MPIQLKKTAQSAAMTFKKIAIHGRSGIGKTTLAATAAPFNPLVIVTEKTGEESLQPAALRAVFGDNAPGILYDIDYVEAYTPEDFEAAVKYATKSPHDLIIFDSASKASRLILKSAKKSYADGRKAYGQHNDLALGLIEEMMDLEKHAVFMCHTTRTEDGESGEINYTPSFEGKAFAEKFTYELAHILHLEIAHDDEGEPYRALRCHQGDTDKFAKNRGGLLKELEKPHLGEIINKLSGKTKKKAK